MSLRKEIIFSSIKSKAYHTKCEAIEESNTAELASAPTDEHSEEQLAAGVISNILDVKGL